jgi:hypothetical protein
MTRYASALAVLVGASLGLMLTYAPQAHAVPTGTTCSASGCYTNEVGDLRVNDSAATDSLEVELCVTTVTRNRTLAANEYLTGAKTLHCDNRSSVTTYLTLDAVSLTTTGSTGYRIAAGDDYTSEVDGSAFGPNVGINATATTTTGACLWCSWLK